jgi:hypothetical protein
MERWWCTVHCTHVQVVLPEVQARITLIIELFGLTFCVRIRLSAGADEIPALLPPPESAQVRRHRANALDHQAEQTVDGEAFGADLGRPTLLPSNAHISTPFFRKTVVFSLKYVLAAPPQNFWRYV